MKAQTYISEPCSKWSIKLDKAVTHNSSFYSLYKDGEFKGRVLMQNNPTVRQCMDDYFSSLETDKQL